MSDKLKIAVIANCQTQAISNYLRIITGCTDITNVPVHMFGSELYNKALARLSNVIDDENGVIFTFNLSQNFGDIQFHYIEMFYNPKRRHTSKGRLSPTVYDRQYFRNMESV